MFGMFVMWDVGDVGCWGCGMLTMWDVRDVGCGMFAGMWDIDLQNAFYLVDSFFLPTLISDIAEPCRLFFLLSCQLLNFQLHSASIASNVIRSSLIILIGVALTSSFVQSLTDSD